MSDALQSFLALAKGARGRAAAAVVADATAAPGLFAFGELLDVQGVKELAGTEFAPALELLRLFAFGTLAEYKAAAASGALPPLSPAQLLKLKQLTVASLAEETKVLPYDTLAAALDEPLPPGASVRALEDFLINDCFGTGLIKGKLDQRRRCLEVHWAAARDMKPGQLERMQATLAQWVEVTSGVVDSLQQRSAWAAKQTAEAAAHAAEFEAKLEGVRKSVKAELELRGAQEGPLGFDGGMLGAGAALMMGAGGDHDDDRGPGGRPKRRR